MLEGGHVHWTLERTRPDTVRVNTTLFGKRLDIEVFEDDHVESSRFRGDEDVEGDVSSLEAILLDVILKDEAPPSP